MLIGCRKLHNLPFYIFEEIEKGTTFYIMFANLIHISYHTEVDYLLENIEQNFKLRTGV